MGIMTKVSVVQAGDSGSTWLLILLGVLLLLPPCVLSLCRVADAVEHYLDFLVLLQERL